MSLDALNNYTAPKTDLPEEKQEYTFAALDDVMTISASLEDTIDEVSEQSLLQEKSEQAGMDMDLFNAYFESIDDPDIQSELQELIKSENVSKIKLKIYIARNGSIVNDDTRIAFMREFTPRTDDEVQANFNSREAEADSRESETDSRESETDSRESETDSRESEKIIETAELQNKAEDFLDLFQDKQSSLGNINGLYECIKSITDKLDGEIKEGEDFSEIDTFFESLEHDDVSFDKIAHSFDSQGEAEYQAYREYAISKNDGLREQFIRYEASRGINSPTPESELHRAQIAAGLDNNPQAAHKYGQFMEIQDGDDITVMNIGTEPPSREVGISGSPMRLEKNVPVGDFYEAVADEGLEYEKFSAQNDPTIDAIYSIEQNTDAILATLEGDSSIAGAEEAGLGDLDDVETQDIVDIKQEIESQLGLPDSITLDSLANSVGKSLNSRNDIKDFIQSTDISALLGRLKDEKESKRLAYQKALREKSFAVSVSMEEGDALARDVIKAFYGFGIDIAWEDLESLLANTEVQNHLVNTLKPNFSLEHLDLANGKFGQSGTNKDSVSVLHENIAKFANIIYFGEPEPQDSPIQMGVVSQYSKGNVPPPTSEIISLREGKDMLINGTVNRVLIQQRLSGK